MSCLSPPRSRWFSALAAAFSVFMGAPSLGHAKPEAPAPPEDRSQDSFVGTQILFELGLSWLVLPGAEICDTEQCVRGDSTPLIGLWGLVRPHRRFAIGGGATLGFWPTKTIPQPEAQDAIKSRSYLTLEAVARYAPVLRPRWSWWIGPGVGLCVVSDRFMSQKLIHNRYERIGDPGAQLSTEGLSLLLSSGLSYELTRVLHVGLGARGGAFFFPQEPATTALGDRASVSGTNLVVSGGLAVSLVTDP